MESTPSKAEFAQSNKQLTWRGIFALILLAGALGAGWAVRHRLFPALTVARAACLSARLRWWSLMRVPSGSP